MQPRSMAQVWLSVPARVLGEACLLGEIGEFALDGGAVNVQQEGTSAHGDAGAEHATKRVIHAALALLKLEGARGVGEARAAGRAAEALDEARLTTSIETSVLGDESFGPKGQAG